MGTTSNVTPSQDAIAKALGSASSAPIGDEQAIPTGLLGLAHRFNERLRSTGGRPTDPTWTVGRRVPFSAETWDALNTIATQLSTPERKVAPAQVAAALIEDGVAELDQAAKRAFAQRGRTREGGECPS